MQKSFEKYDLIIADELGYISFDREGADPRNQPLSHQILPLSGGTRYLEMLPLQVQSLTDLHIRPI